MKTLLNTLQHLKRLGNMVLNGQLGKMLFSSATTMISLLPATGYFLVLCTLQNSEKKMDASPSVWLLLIGKSYILCKSEPNLFQQSRKQFLQIFCHFYPFYIPKINYSSVLGVAIFSHHRTSPPEHCFTSTKVLAHTHFSYHQVKAPPLHDRYSSDVCNHLQKITFEKL